MKNAFWSIANSDPYHASSYDLLHADDLGKWGKHLWPLLLDVLEDLKKKGEYSNKYIKNFLKFYSFLIIIYSMNHIPRWPNLKHFESITTLDFSDGQGYLDALKVSYISKI